MQSFRERVLGAARLDVATYEEVEHDPGALGQALGVVLLAGAAAGVAGLADGPLGGALAGMLGAIVGWGIWSALVYVIGARLLPEAETQANLAQLLRTCGFAAAPGLIRVLGVLAVVRPIVELVATLWMIAAMVVAVRQALDYRSTGRAIGVCVIGWLVQLIVVGALLLALVPREAPLMPPPAADASARPSAAAVDRIYPSAIAPPVD